MTTALIIPREQTIFGDPDVTVVVHGTPAPQGSKAYKGHRTNRATGKRLPVLIESSKKVKPWRDAVKTAALTAVTPGTWQPLDGPLLVSMTFSFARPKGHYRTGRNAHLLRDGAPARPAVYPDISKIARSTEDALTDAGIWKDDAQVVEYACLAKHYAGAGYPDVLPNASGAVIRVWRLTH